MGTIAKVIWSVGVDMMLLRALVSLAGMVMIATLLTYAGCAAIAEPISEYGQARQETEQARIEWGAKVEIAEIEADADKKTSFNYVIFYVIRLAAWVLGLLVLSLAGITASQKFLAVAR